MRYVHEEMNMKSVIKEIPLDRLPTEQLLERFHRFAEIAGRAYSDPRAERRACENFQAARKEAVRRGLVVGGSDEALLAETQRLTQAASLAYRDPRDANRAYNNLKRHQAEVNRRGLAAALAC